MKCSGIKLSKSLNETKVNFEDLPRSLIYYLLCSRKWASDIEISTLDVKKAESDLINNMGNLVKRLSKLIYLHGFRIKRITISDWLLYLYAKHSERIIKRYLVLFKINLILSLLLRQSAWINNRISNCKLWCNKNIGHKLYVYSHITTYICLI